MRESAFLRTSEFQVQSGTTDSDHGGPIALTDFEVFLLKDPTDFGPPTHLRPSLAKLVISCCRLGCLHPLVIGWLMHQILDAQLVVSALRMA